jgi:hypothetical protein
MTTNGNKLINEHFHPIHYLKNLFNKKQEIFDRGNSWELKEEMQKYADSMYRLTQSIYPLKTIKGFEVVKITSVSSKEIIIVMLCKVPKYVDPKNPKLRKEFEIFTEAFRRVREIMAFKSTDSDNPVFLDFKLYLQ